MNWWDRIERAKKRGWFTDSDKERSMSWISCACGSVDRRIHRFPVDYCGFYGEDRAGAPTDHLLWNFGLEFMDAVEADKPDAARIFLIWIEKREQELLSVLA